MRPHWPALALIFDTFLYSSNAARKESDEGYRCGRRIFTLEFLEKSAKEAANWLTLGVFPTTHEVGTSYPTAHLGILSHDKVSDQWFLPFSVDIETFTLVLGTGRSSIVGVNRQPENKPCIMERDLSDLLGSEFGTGYRCPFAIFPFQVIDNAIEKAKNNANRNIRQKSRVSVVDMSFPKAFDALPLYPGIRNTRSWPIAPNERFSYLSRVSIIIDEQYDLVGVVGRKFNDYFRCKVTASDSIIPKFAGRALEQQPQLINREYLDVFECSQRIYIKSEEILAAVANAPQIYANKVTQGKPRGYPRPYRHPHNHVTQSLFVFPFGLNSGWRAYKLTKFTYTQRYHAIIDDFSDVHGVTYMTPKESMECVRKSLDKKVYQQFLMAHLENERLFRN